MIFTSFLHMNYCLFNNVKYTVCKGTKKCFRAPQGTVDTVNVQH